MRVTSNVIDNEISTFISMCGALGVDSLFGRPVDELCHHNGGLYFRHPASGALTPVREFQSNREVVCYLMGLQDALRGASRL